MDPILILAETAAVATPAVATWTYAKRGRRRLRAALRQPLFWDGGQAVSIATIFNELNGEGDLEGELRQLIGGAGPLELVDLERAVAMLQGSPPAAKRLIAEVASNAVLQGPVTPDMATGVAMLERLAAKQEALGFFSFVASLSEDRPAALPALLPIESLLPGGFALAAPADGEAVVVSGGGAGVLGAIQAFGQNRGDWVSGAMRVVEDLVRDRHVKKAKDAYMEALAGLGRAGGEALKRHTPAGEAVRRNVYAPLDAYKNLATRMGAVAMPGPTLGERLVPSVAAALRDDFRLSLARATAIVTDQCASLERTLLARSNPALAGEILFRHQSSLLAGVAAGAFPLGAVAQARDAYKAAAAGEPG